PLIPLAYVAAITKTIRLATGVLILPQRHPIYTAKEVATVDVLSGGRVILGIGSGWMKEEFESLGIDFHRRGHPGAARAMGRRHFVVRGQAFQIRSASFKSKAGQRERTNSRGRTFDG